VLYTVNNVQKFIVKIVSISEKNIMNLILLVNLLNARIN